MTYAKITSIGEMTTFGAPVTIIAKTGECIVILLEEEQARLWCSRLNTIVEAINKEKAVAG